MSKRKPKPEPAISHEAVCRHMCTVTGNTKKQVNEFMKALSDLIISHLNFGDPPAFNLMDIVEIRVEISPPTQEREVYSPFHKRIVTVKAKPPRKKVRLKALRFLKKSLLL